MPAQQRIGLDDHQGRTYSQEIAAVVGTCPLAQALLGSAAE